jgi:hypothetical protein
MQWGVRALCEPCEREERALKCSGECVHCVSRGALPVNEANKCATGVPPICSIVDPRWQLISKGSSHAAPIEACTTHNAYTAV